MRVSSAQVVNCNRHRLQQIPIESGIECKAIQNTPFPGQHRNDHKTCQCLFLTTSIQACKTHSSTRHTTQVVGWRVPNTVQDRCKEFSSPSKLKKAYSNLLPTQMVDSHAETFPAPCKCCIAISCQFRRYKSFLMNDMSHQ